jgi:hypothetical protein
VSPRVEGAEPDEAAVGEPPAVAGNREVMGSSRGDQMAAVVEGAAGRTGGEMHQFGSR